MGTRHVFPSGGALSAVILAIGLALSSPALATAPLQPLPLFNTGVDAAGALLAGGSVDPHYTLIASADAAFPGPNAIVTTAIAQGYWMPNGPNSKWIAPSANQDYPNTGPCNANGQYRYRTSFDLTGFDPESVVITGGWAGDNMGTMILLNGAQAGYEVSGFGAFLPFTLSSGFVSGVNTIVFVVFDSGCPTGLRVELSGTALAAAAPDTTPDAFSFVDQFLVPTSTAVTSAPVQIAGLTSAAPVTVIGGTYALSSTNSCVGDVQGFTASPGAIANGQYVCVRHVSSPVPGGSTDTQLIVGGLGDTFNSITIDTVPAPFPLAPQSGVALSSTRVSAPVVIAGINTGSPVTVASGEVSIGCGATYVTSGTVLPGQAICARHVAAGAFNASTTTTVTVGGVSADFVSTTFDAAGDADNDGIPNAVEYLEARNPEAMDNDVFANARLFTMQQYRDFLGREGDAGGIPGWTDAVATGAWTRAQVIDAFLGSPEFAGSVAPVVRLYFATFLRIPDYAGVTYNAGLVRDGTVTIAQLADFFTTGPEFTALYGTLDNAQFVTLLYTNVLNRAPDSGGLAAWVNLLDTGTTRGQVLLGFSNSAEYQAAMANEVFVTMMYAGMLRRTPDQSGFNGWVGALDAGSWTREQVIGGFLLSAEYHDRFLP